MEWGGRIDCPLALLEWLAPKKTPRINLGFEPALDI